MKRKTRSSAKVLRWKASGPPRGIAAGGSSGGMELVQQQLPFKEGTAGLRVITVILAVMLLHVVFIGGIALYNLFVGGTKSARIDGSGQKGPVAAAASGSRLLGKPEGVKGSAGAPSSPVPSLVRGSGGKRRTDLSRVSGTEDPGQKKGVKKQLRRLSSKESAGESVSPESAAATERRSGTAPPESGRNEPTSPASPVEASSRTYHVVHGDTLWRIARRFHVGLSDLMAANGLSASSKLHIGQELRIPPTKPARSRRGTGVEG
ncbi:LysM peptidoglycan-binding domain-containing protein [Methylacidimicrobium tartarophylax]|uniref:Putative endopeptidase p60 n=1 Tax=Methylacidimicrobium tartarophylax TaxID=1041768 RepID=A0A5E6M865_9BACT|nr:LysM domain-containing protein [Methylacidimicrobium tartarophylax]VVM04591.1 putative endopeptidase p60 [Methylacidimicrobium tartarophylax]